MRLIRNVLDTLLETKNLLFLLFFLALATRMLGAFIGGHRADDDGSHFNLAMHLVQGHGFRWHPERWSYAYLPPGMGLIMAPFLYFFENPLIPLKIFFVVMSAFATVLFFPLAKRVVSPRMALLGTLFWIFYPPQWFWASRSNPHTFATNMLIFMFYLLFLAWDKRSPLLAFLVGLLWAAVSIARAEFALGIAVLSLGCLLTKLQWKVKAQLAAVVFLGCVVGLLPWLARNYGLFGKWVMATNYGLNVWHAYNPDYTYGGDIPPLPPRMVKKIEEAPDEIGRAEVFMEEARAYIKENPSTAVKRVVLNFLNFWRPWLSFRVASPFENALYITSYLPLFFLFVFGIWRVPWKNPFWFVMVGTLFYKVLIHVPFYVIVRFRESLVPILILVALLPLSRYIEKRSK